jgi:hypothetical protein
MAVVLKKFLGCVGTIGPALLASFDWSVTSFTYKTALAYSTSRIVGACCAVALADSIRAMTKQRVQGNVVIAMTKSPPLRLENQPGAAGGRLSGKMLVQAVQPTSR